MVGIYRILNIRTGQSYIGQSHDIAQRYKEHMYHKSSPIDYAIHSDGLNNFIFYVVEECKPEELDQKEEYYITKFDSINNGYNRIHGGQHNMNESNPMAKLTEQDVYDIRESYRMHESKRKVYERYKDKISFYHFSNVWEGKIWPTIHSDVFTPENIRFYASNGGANNKFTTEQVIDYRVRYVNETAKQIYESTNKSVSMDSFQKMLRGYTYKNIPVYDKSISDWSFYLKPVSTISLRESTTTIGT